MKTRRFTRKPTTPGEILKEEYLIPLGLTQKIVADHLGIDIKVINRLVNGKTSVSSELVLKLASAFDTSPEFWSNAQKCGSENISYEYRQAMLLYEFSWEAK